MLLNCELNNDLGNTEKAKLLFYSDIFICFWSAQWLAYR